MEKQDDNFLENLQKAKNNASSELEAKMDMVRFEALKDLLKRKNIKVDDNIKDISELREIVKAQNSSVKKEVAKLDEMLKGDLNELISSLKNGSESAFSKFSKNLKNTLGHMTVGMAVRTGGKLAAGYFAMPVIAPIVTGTSLIAPHLKKTYDVYKKNQEDNYDKALNVVLLELSKTSADGKNYKMEISKGTMENVKDIFGKNGIYLNTNDTIHFIDDVVNLDTESKKRVIASINNFEGNKVDLEEEIKKSQKSISKLSKSVKKDVVRPLMAGAATGVRIATTANATNPELTASIITGIASAGLSGNIGIGIAAGGSQYALSQYGSFIPVVGRYIDKVTETINKTENFTTITTGVIAITGVTILGKCVYKGAKHILDKKRGNKKEKENEKLYGDEIRKKLSEAKKDASEEMKSRTDKQIMLDVLCDELRRKGMDIPEGVNSPAQLQVLLKTASKEEKKYAIDVLKDLNQYHKENNVGFKDKIKGIAKTAYWGGIITLAGLGAYDIFLNPGFLDSLSKDKNKLIDEISTNKNKIKGSAEKINEDIDSLGENSLSSEEAKKYEVKIPKITGIEETLEGYNDNISYDNLNSIGTPESLSKYGTPSGIKTLIQDLNVKDSNGLIKYVQNINVSDDAKARLLAQKDSEMFNSLKDMGVIENKTPFPINLFLKDWKVDYDKFDKLKENSELSLKFLESAEKNEINPDSKSLNKFLNSLVTDDVRLEESDDIQSYINYFKLTDDKAIDWDETLHTSEVKALNEAGYKDIDEFWAQYRDYKGTGVSSEELSKNLKKLKLNTDVKSKSGILGIKDKIQKLGLKPLDKNSDAKDKFDNIAKLAGDNEELRNQLKLLQQAEKFDVSDLSNAFLETLENIQELETNELALNVVESHPISRNPLAVFGIGATIGGIGSVFSNIKRTLSKKVNFPGNKKKLLLDPGDENSTKYNLNENRYNDMYKKYGVSVTPTIDSRNIKNSTQDKSAKDIEEFK